jgi:hypothetical protein
VPEKRATLAKIYCILFLIDLPSSVVSTRHDTTRMPHGNTPQTSNRGLCGFTHFTRQYRGQRDRHAQTSVGMHASYECILCAHPWLLRLLCRREEPCRRRRAKAAGARMRPCLLPARDLMLD